MLPTERLSVYSRQSGQHHAGRPSSSNDQHDEVCAKLGVLRAAPGPWALGKGTTFLNGVKHHNMSGFNTDFTRPNQGRRCPLRHTHIIDLKLLLRFTIQVFGILAQ
jgi:hypothetical protein